MREKISREGKTAAANQRPEQVWINAGPVCARAYKQILNCGVYTSIYLNNNVLFYVCLVISGSMSGSKAVNYRNRYYIVCINGGLTSAWCNQEREKSYPTITETEQTSIFVLIKLIQIITR